MSYLGNNPNTAPSIVVSEHVATEGQTTFSASYYEYVQVFLNGMLLSASDYTANDGSTVVLAVGANAGDVVLISGYEVGLQGIKGDTGAQGLKGDTGATGPQGIQGPIGPQGEVTLAQLNAAIDGVDALPSQTGNNGKYLTTDGTNASWGTVDLSTKQNTLVSGTNIKTINGASVLGSGDMVLASGGSFDMQVFTTSGTWTKPTGVSMVRIILCGGGGGGASGSKCGTTVTQVALGGSGGGGGGVCDLTIPTSVFGATVSVTVGAAGVGGTGLGTGTVANGYPGMDGTTGSTSFGTFTVTGGQHGDRCTPQQNPQTTGGTGGTSYTSDISDTSYSSLNYQSTVHKRTFGSANVMAQIQAGGVAYFTKYVTIFGGACSGKTSTASQSPYISQIYGAETNFGGSAGASGQGIYLSNGTSTRAIEGGQSGGYTIKFLPSYFGNYTSVAGIKGTLSGYVLTGTATSGGNATGYGAGGGGGASCDENNTPGNGGNGSPGIAIIISW